VVSHLLCTGFGFALSVLNLRALKKQSHLLVVPEHLPHPHPQLKTVQIFFNLFFRSLDFFQAAKKECLVILLLRCWQLQTSATTTAFEYYASVGITASTFA
jgi:hypothetical protein